MSLYLLKWKCNSAQQSLVNEWVNGMLVIEMVQISFQKVFQEILKYLHMEFVLKNT